MVKKIVLNDKDIKNIQNAILKEFYASEISYFSQIVFVSEPMEYEYMDPLSDISVMITSIVDVWSYYNNDIGIEDIYKFGNYNFGTSPPNYGETNSSGKIIFKYNAVIYQTPLNRDLMYSHNYIDRLAYLTIHEVIHRATQYGKCFGQYHIRSEMQSYFLNRLDDHEFGTTMQSGGPWIFEDPKKWPRGLSYERKIFLFDHFGSTTPIDNATTRKKEATGRETFKSRSSKKENNNNVPKF